MAQNDVFKRYLDAGLAFTQLTRSRAEAIVKDLVKAGEVQRDQAQERVEELVDRSRKNTEQLVQLVRREVAGQVQSLGLVTRNEMRRLLSGGARPGSRTGPARRAPAAKRAPANRTAARRAPARRAAVRRAAARRAPAKRAAPA